MEEQGNNLEVNTLNKETKQTSYVASLTLEFAQNIYLGWRRYKLQSGKKYTIQRYLKSDHINMIILGSDFKLNTVGISKIFVLQVAILQLFRSSFLKDPHAGHYKKKDTDAGLICYYI